MISSVCGTITMLLTYKRKILPPTILAFEFEEKPMQRRFLWEFHLPSLIYSLHLDQMNEVFLTSSAHGLNQHAITITNQCILNLKYAQAVIRKTQYSQ